MPVFPSDAPFELAWPQRWHAVHRGREYRASQDELAATAVLRPISDAPDRPGGLGSPVSPDGPGIRVNPAELESWTRDWTAFRWRGEPFVYRGHDTSIGVVAGDYAGSDRAFAEAHLRHYGDDCFLGYLPLGEITDMTMEQRDLLTDRAAQARALEALGPLGPRTVATLDDGTACPAADTADAQGHVLLTDPDGATRPVPVRRLRDWYITTRTYRYRNEEFEPYALDGLWVKCRYLGTNYFVWAHWILDTERSPKGDTVGFARRRPTDLAPELTEQRTDLLAVAA
jgi:hypothetical protein